MRYDHLPSEHSFASLMASLCDVPETPATPVERMQDANRKLQEATVRLKQSNARMEAHLAELRLHIARLVERHPELDDKRKPKP